MSSLEDVYHVIDEVSKATQLWGVSCIESYPQIQYTGALGSNLQETTTKFLYSSINSIYIIVRRIARCNGRIDGSQISVRDQDHLGGISVGPISERLPNNSNHWYCT